MKILADSTIGSLPAIQIMQNADLFVLEQNGTAKKMSGEQLSSYIDRQIVSITVVERAATETYTASYNADTGVLTLGIPRGVGIASITNPVVSGLNKTYTIIWEKPASASVATTKEYTVKDGNGIVSIQAIDDAHVHGGMDHYRINFDEGSPMYITVRTVMVLLVRQFLSWMAQPLSELQICMLVKTMCIRLILPDRKRCMR